LFLSTTDREETLKTLRLTFFFFQKGKVSEVTAFYFQRNKKRKREQKEKPGIIKITYDCKEKDNCHYYK